MVLLIMYRGMIAIKLCPGVKVFLLIHRGCTAIKWNSPLIDICEQELARSRWSKNEGRFDP